MIVYYALLGVLLIMGIVGYAIAGALFRGSSAARKAQEREPKRLL